MTLETKDGKLVASSEAKALPTADDVEEKYNHSRPTSKHVEKGIT